MKKITLLIFISFAVLIGCPPPGTDPTQPGGDDKIAVTSVKIKSGITEISMDLSAKLNVEVLPANASNKEVTWTSSDDTVLTVEDGVVTAQRKPGTVTVTAASVSDPSVKGTVSITVLDVREVVYRDGKAYRLGSYFDFSQTGTDKTWTNDNADSNKLTPAFENGVLKLPFTGATMDKGYSYPLVLAAASYKDGIPSGKQFGYVEISAKLSTNGVGSGIGIGLGTGETSGTASGETNQKRGWANEFMNDYSGGLKIRLQNTARSGALDVAPNEWHLFGIAFDASRLTGFFEGEATHTENVDSSKAFNLVDKTTGEDYGTYYLYVGTEGKNNGLHNPVDVEIDYIAFYYTDETIEIYDPTVLPPPAEGKIPAAMMAEGKKLSLTYYDPFDSMETLKADWDIGNPGIYRPEIGNMGLELSNVKDFGDGIKGYENDRYKQPYWSPQAVRIKDGCLYIDVYYDPSIPNKNISTTTSSTEEPDGDNFIPNVGANADPGYGLAGAIHSKRQFPSGLFVTKIRHDFSGRANKNGSHWDAWWAESNNPFSKKYGEKDLFMPPGAQAGVNQIAKYKFNNDGNLHSTVSARGLNGQQVYEYDMYEWVEADNKQWMVTHMWSWYGGYPGWDDRMAQGVTYGGANNGNYYITNDFRANDKAGASGRIYSSYNDGGQAKSQEWFYLVMLVIPGEDGGVKMWNFSKDWNWDLNDKESLVHSASETFHMGCFSNSECPTPFPADTYAPIQVKYSSELGSWNNDHNEVYNARSTLTKDAPDSTVSEFFAFYAWDTESGTYHKYEEDVDM